MDMKFKKGEASWNKGKPNTWMLGVPRSEETKKKISVAQQNVKNRKPSKIKGEKDVILICGNCGNDFNVVASRKNRAKYCCKKCYSIHQTTIKSKLKGKKLSKSHVENLKKSHIGKVGSLSSNWKGGITKESFKIRNSKEYKCWRLKVFERDNYKCVLCGYDKGNILQADHIKPFAYYPELRLDISNGRTLCKPCHEKTDTYLSKSAKPKGIQV